ncbi:hypothetical protein SK128_012511 [Halocaridina rubra]|uniref:VWFA domain-containing protein n=1 Tax=Halocaridina rubra TaxID=373956 RepID=A0AAN8WQX3_HALRR
MRAIQVGSHFSQRLICEFRLCFLTDGRPNLGEKKPNQLRRNIREANIHHHPIFSLGFGHDADMRLLRQVSSDNRGLTRKIDEDIRPAEQLRGFYEEISAPLMTDVDVMYLEDEVDPNSVVRHGPSTFYAGDEMVLAGQLVEGATQVQPIITGQGSSGPLQFRVSRISTTEPPPERDNYVERLWAYLSVQDLLEMQEVVEDSNLRAEMNARALEIAIRFHFVTGLTALDLEDPIGSHNGDNHPYKSASRHQKSNTGGQKFFPKELTLLSEAEFAETIPPVLTTHLDMSSHYRFSFGDNDPHFVVQVSGLEMPLCFDIHGQHGHVLNLVRDQNSVIQSEEKTVLSTLEENYRSRLREKGHVAYQVQRDLASGILVTGRVTAAVGRPEATYFTEIFIAMRNVNFTITPHNITISTFVNAEVDSEMPMQQGLPLNRKQRQE